MREGPLPAGAVSLLPSNSGSGHEFGALTILLLV